MYITMDEGERGELDTLLRGIRAQVHSHPTAYTPLKM